MDMLKFFVAAASLTVIAGMVWADSHETECALSYEVFEAAVPHTDMDECPVSMQAGEDDFCRMSVVAEVATVFVFSYESGCLTKTRSYEDDQFSFEIK